MKVQNPKILFVLNILLGFFFVGEKNIYIFVDREYIESCSLIFSVCGEVWKMGYRMGRMSKRKNVQTHLLLFIVSILIFIFTIYGIFIFFHHFISSDDWKIIFELSLWL